MPVESEIATQIRTALAKRLKRDVSKVRLEDNLRDDLGLDSLSMLEMVFEVEEAFNLEIPDDDLSKVTTVGDVVTYVESRLAGGAPRPAPASPAAPAPTAAPAAPSAPASTAAPAATPKKKAPRRA
jgi:acyl carrier protein